MSGKAILGGALIIFAATLAGGGVYALHTLKERRFDPETLCPLEGVKAVTLIIIDKTDPLTPAEQARIRDLVSEERDSVQRGGRLTVRLLQQRPGASETALDTLADLCNPGNEANPLFENPKRIAARYEAGFREPIQGALASFESAGPAPVSPIAAAIHAGLEAVPASAGRHLKLVLISDLMEHTAEASAYAGTLSEAALRKAMPESTRMRLNGAEIRIVLLARPRHAQRQDASVEIWRRFLRAASQREPDMVRP